MPSVNDTLLNNPRIESGSAAEKDAEREMRQSKAQKEFSFGILELNLS